MKNSKDSQCEIRTKHLPNKSLQCYHRINLFSCCLLNHVIDMNTLHGNMWSFKCYRDAAYINHCILKC
jgi:hypothetical protein